MLYRACINAHRIIHILHIISFLTCHIGGSAAHCLQTRRSSLSQFELIDWLIRIGWFKSIRINRCFNLLLELFEYMYIHMYIYMYICMYIYSNNSNSKLKHLLIRIDLNQPIRINQSINSNCERLERRVWRQCAALPPMWQVKNDMIWRIWMIRCALMHARYNILFIYI